MATLSLPPHSNLQEDCKDLRHAFRGLLAKPYPYGYWLVHLLQHFQQYLCSLLLKKFQPWPTAFQNPWRRFEDTVRHELLTMLHVVLLGSRLASYYRIRSSTEHYMLQWSISTTPHSEPPQCLIVFRVKDGKEQRPFDGMTKRLNFAGVRNFVVTIYGMQ